MFLHVIRIPRFVSSIRHIFYPRQSNELRKTCRLYAIQYRETDSKMNSGYVFFLPLDLYVNIVFS